MAEIIRLPPAEVSEKLKSGQALLVCAYPSEERFRSLRLEGAISLQEFESRVPSLPKDQEIIFYCA
jgi:rhodanese-related sulfurtransferase